MFIGIGVGVGRQRFGGGGIFAAYAARVAADGGVTEAGACVNAVSGISLDASLLLVPSGYKSGVVYSEIPTNGDGDLTFTRASTATRVNSDGLIESVATGVPRLDYTNSSCPSLLLEPQRTNTFVQSENLFTTHLVQNLTTSGYTNVAISPDGTQNAEKFVPTSTNGVHGIANGSLLAITSGQSYSFSAFVKSDGGAYNLISLTFDSTTAWGATKNCIFNASTGASYSVPSGATMSSQSMGNGWYRITATLTATGSVSSSLYQYRIYIADTNGNLSWAAPSGNTNGIFVWGAQLEQGAYPTSYIPTTTASATRISDSFSRNNIYTNGLITSSGGTWFVELRGNLSLTADAGGDYIVLSDQTGTSGNGFRIRNFTGTERISIYKIVVSNTTLLYTTTTDTVKFAIKWNGSTADVFVNGTKVVSETSFTRTNMQFFASEIKAVPRFIQAMALYPTPLSDTELASLTTI